jgi:2-polyprenyl-3-methyl-5-hydroxy-6-metoxy-1,4-benzoquinol methylase
MLEISECPICKGKSFLPKAECVDYTVSHETFHIKQCQKCQLAITSPRPENDQLGSYYNSQEYISHSGKSSGGIGTIYKVARSFALNWKKNLIHQFKKGNSALDFGCGTGDFIHTLQTNGWNVQGIEPSETARRKASDLSGDIVKENLSELGDKKFDAITAWHVLEHVPDLTGTISQLKNLLVEGGVLFIAVPNYQSPDSLKYSNYWAGYDVPRHLWHFSKESMTQLLHSQGFKLLKVVPMKLDSYYISLLSEKYRNTNRPTLLNMFKAFTNGFISNLKARKNTNHSSLIYIARIHEE